MNANKEGEIFANIRVIRGQEKGEKMVEKQRALFKEKET
jgi:hypothetical protein